MNLSLQKELVHHIFNRFGFLTTKIHTTIENLSDKKFLLPEQFSFEGENNKFKNNVWGGIINVEGNKIKVVIADLTQDALEYAGLIQLDNFQPFAIRISADPEDAGDCFFRIENNWIEATMLFQAKLLVAVETLDEVMIDWNILSEYKASLKTLIDFIKFESNR